MKQRCIVHVGPPKTGSTSIQHTLFSELTDPGFEYAKIGSSNHGGTIHSVFAQSPEESGRRRFREPKEKETDHFRRRAKRRLARAIRQSRAPTVIISGEAISNIDEEGLAGLRDFLEEHFDEILVVGYVRPPQAMMQSWYQMRIKWKFPELDMPRLYQTYRDRFEKFDRVFGVERAQLWKFASEDFPDGDVVKDFFKRLGIGPPNRFVRVNESLSLPAVQALYAFHKYGPDLGAGPDSTLLKKAIVRGLSDMKGERLRFSPELVKPVLEANRDDIEWMENRIGASLAEPEQRGENVIGGEADLLKIGPAGIAALEELVGSGPAERDPDLDAPHYAAALVGTLAGSIAAKGKAGLKNRGQGKAGGRRDKERPAG